MIPRLTLSLFAVGCMMAAANAAPMSPAASAKPVAAAEMSHLETGRSAFHRHWNHGGYRHWHHRHYGWHRHWHHGYYGFHRGWHCHHRWHR